MIFSLAHQKGGSGKSTIAWELAINFLNKGKNVRILDCDIQHTCIATNLMRNGAISEGASIMPLDVRAIDSAKGLASFANNDSDDIIQIIDVGGYDDGLMRLALAISDFVITPLSYDYRVIAGLPTFTKALREVDKKIKEETDAFILYNNMSYQRSDFSVVNEMVKKLDRYKKLSSILRTRADYGNAIFAGGKSVTEYNPKGKASEEFSALADEVENLIKGVING